MKKFFTLCVSALMAATSFADTEILQSSTQGAKNEASVATSFTVAGTYNPGPGATMLSYNGTNIKSSKWRTNQNGNTLELTVNEGYEISAIAGVMTSNYNGTDVTVTAIQADGVDVLKTPFTATHLDNGNATNFSVSGFSAAKTLVFYFSNNANGIGANAGNQINLVAEVTYGKAAPATDVTPLVGNWTVDADVTVSGAQSGSNHFNFQTVKVAASETKGCVDVTVPACSYDKYAMAETQFKGLAVSMPYEGEYAIAGENLPVVVNGQTLSAKITYCSFMPAHKALKMYVEAQLPNGLGTMQVVYSIVNPAIALTAEVDGAERTFEIATLTAGENVMVDWGDGNIVKACESIVYDGYDAGKFAGVVKGEGNVKIYANGVNYFDCVSKVSGPSLTSLDVTNAPDLQYLYANGNVKLESVDLTKSTELLKMSLANNPTKSIDLTQCTKLTRLEMQGVAATPSALETIDLSANTELTYLQLNYNKLTTLDLSKNTKLGSIYALNNELTSVVLPESCPCTYASFNNNKLTSFDGACFTSMSKTKGSIFLMNNLLTEVKNLSAKSVNVNGNYLTFATLPSLDNIGALTYNTQNDVQVAETVATLDFSAQGATTTLAVFTEAGVAQTEGVTIENGVITFDASLNGQKFYVQMKNSVYSKLTLKTTVFTVDVPVPPVVAIVKGEGTYTVTSTSETAALYYLCKPMSWLDEGETPESVALAQIEGMGSMIDSEETWELYDHMGMEPAPKTFAIADYQEMYAGEDMFLVAANVGWNGEKLAVISNIAIEYFGVPTGIKNVTAAKAINGKFIENGKLVIISNGKKFNAAGVEMK